MKKIAAFVAVATISGFIFPAPTAAAPNKPTTTTVTTSASPVVINTLVTLTATVAATGNPDGSISFTVNSASIGSCTTTNSTCSITYTWTSRGTYPVTATFTPSTNHLSSTSAALNEVVTRYSSSVVVVSSKPDAYIGNPLDFTITASGAGPTPTGVITLYAYESNTVIGTCTLDSASCVIHLAASTVGNHRVWASYSGDDSYYLPSDSPYIYQHNVAKLAPVITISDSPTTSNFGDPVVFTAIASGADGTPVGSILFENSEGSLGSCTMTGGTCSITVSSLTVGVHTITAEFGGDSTYSGDEATLTHTVNAVALATSTTVTSSSNPSIEGRSETFTVIVTASTGTPTGDVTVKIGSTPVGSCTLVAGSCTYATALLPVGETTLTAYYGGSALYLASDGSITQTINSAGARTTATSITPSVDSTTVGSTVTLRIAVVNSEVVTGTVILKDGETVINSCTLTAGSCDISFTPATVGSHTLTAIFLANATFDTSTASLIYAVHLRTSTMTFTANHNPAARLTLVTYSVTLHSSATGLVIFEDGEDQIGDCTLVGGACTTSVSFASVGTHHISAEYGGDALNTGITEVLDQVVGLTSTTVTLTSDDSLAEFYQSINFTAVVSDPAATGNIEVSADGAGIKSCTLVAGECTLFFYRLTVGSHDMTATYSGDANHAGSTSPILVQVVTLAPTSTTLLASENPFVYGAGLTLTGTVTSNGIGATGMIQFEDYTSLPSSPIGSCTIVGTLCSITLSPSLSVGTHKIKAEYVGDENYAGSISGELLQVITEGGTPPPVETKTVTTAVIAAVPVSALFLESIAFTAVVSSDSGTATGLIVFEEELAGGGEGIVGNCILSSGQCTFSSSNLSVGVHEIYFEYGGSTTHHSSLSGTVLITITPRPVVAVATSPTEPTPSLQVVMGKPIVTTINESKRTEVDFTVKDVLGHISTVSIIVPAGTVPSGATLTIQPEASVKADEKGFVALEIRILSTGSTPITRLEHPILLKISRQASIAIPAMSIDGENWFSIKEVTNTSLSENELDGYFVGENSSMNVMTVHLSMLDMLKKQHRISVQSIAGHIHLGQSLQLSYRGGSGKGEVAFSTSTPNVCSVSSSGVMTALAVGNCLVSVSKGHDEEYMNIASEAKVFAIRPQE